MEARLFFISLWCGVYGLVLRQVFKRQEENHHIAVTIFLNSFFWATVGFLAGMLRASYLTSSEFQLKFSLFYAVAGFLYGGIMGVVKNKAKLYFSIAVWSIVGIAFGLNFAKGMEGIRAILYPVISLGVFGVMAKSLTQQSINQGNVLKDNLEWGDTGFSAILLASVVMFFIIQAFKIPSGSMRMTFVEGDHLFVNKFIYGVPVPFTKKKVMKFTKVKTGDVVIFRFPTKDRENPHYGKDFIKRVVATAGQTVVIKDKVLLVDGEVQEESFKQHVDPNTYSPSFSMSNRLFQEKWQNTDFSAFGGNDIRDNFGPIEVPENHVMVMGDNRDRSFDSRFWGPLPLDAIKGKALLLYLPLNRFRLVH